MVATRQSNRGSSSSSAPRLRRDKPLQTRVNTGQTGPGGTAGPRVTGAMSPLPLCLLLGTVLAVNCERHSLIYIYTALSKPVTNPGIHEFTAMGLLDSKMIDYFDSDLQKKVPKQTWMEERPDKDYWDKGTQSRKSKQEWFKVNLDILKERKNQTDHEIHVLQWMHGCEAELLQDGSLQFERGIDQYSYDGDSFLYFDDVQSIWVAAAVEAEQTKRKWNEAKMLKENTKEYLEKECLDWLRKFMNFGKQQLIHAKQPDVYLFASPARQKSSVRLNCMATGFYPPDIVLKLFRDGRLLKPDDGITTTGIRANQDDTYQLRDSIEILRTDQGRYTCEVIHAATKVHIKEEWDGVLPAHDDDGVPVGAVVGGVCVLLVLIGLIVVGAVLYKKHQDRVIVVEAVPFNPPSSTRTPADSRGSQDSAIGVSSESCVVVVEAVPSSTRTPADSRGSQDSAIGASNQESPEGSDNASSGRGSENLQGSQDSALGGADAGARRLLDGPGPDDGDYENE